MIHLCSSGPFQFKTQIYFSPVEDSLLNLIEFDLLTLHIFALNVDQSWQLYTSFANFASLKITVYKHFPRLLHIFKDTQV